MSPKTILCYLLLHFCTKTFSQLSVNYRPLVSNQEDKIKLIVQINRNYEESINSLSRSEKKILDDLYELRKENLIDEIRGDNFLFGTIYNEKLTQLLKNIQANNPDYDFSKINILLGRSTIPNAYSVGEGTIVINIGLLSQLQNMDQIAFVICHELAHFYLNHGNINLFKLKNEVTYLKNDFKKTDLLLYNRNQEKINILMRHKYIKMSQSRHNEFEADSLGFSIYKKAKYAPAEVIACLKILDEIDNSKIIADLNLHSIFDSKDYTFDDDLIRETGSSFGFMSKPQKSFGDSLKTHPECGKRIFRLKSNVNIHSSSLDRLSDLDSLNEKLRFEMVEVDYRNENYISSIYRALELIGQYPNNEYTRLMIVKSLEKVYNLKLNHQFEIPITVSSNKGFQKVKLLFSKISLKELELLVQSFIANCPTQNLNTQGHLQERYVLAKMTNSEEVIKDLRSKIEKKYPNIKIDEL